MALKMIGAYLMPVEPVVGEVAPTLDLDVTSNMVDRSAAKIDVSMYRDGYGTENVMLAPKVIIGPFIPFPRDLNDGTIVPQFDYSLGVTTLPMERVAGFVPDTVYSPAPVSIFGIGPMLGAIIIELGKAVVVEIAADVTMDTLQRIGQRVVRGYRIRGRTVSKNIERHVQVVPQAGRSGIFKDRKNYSGPCAWWEFWCWMA